MTTSLPGVFFVPLFFSLVIVFGCWLYYALRWRTPARPPRSRIYRCAARGHVYADYRDRPMARCTRCGTMNDVLKR